MGRRTIFVAAIAAALAAVAGLAAWNARVGATHRALETRAALARELLTSSVEPASLARALATPLLDVVVTDRAHGVAYRTRGVALQQVALPPPPQQGRGPVPPEGPDAVRRPHSFLARVGGTLAGIPPLRIISSSYDVILTPDIVGLGLFLIEDVAIVVLIVVAALVVGARTAGRIALAERRRLEATLEERRAAAAEFQRFLADAGHELRTPLTIVSGYVEILEGTLTADERVRQILREMRAESSRMRALVEKMLLLARLDSPVSVPRLVDLSSVAANAADVMRARFPQRRVVVCASTANVIVDPDDAYEAIRNLLENALNYAPASTVELSVSHDETLARVTVSDDGPGIADLEREKIFDRFYRGSAREGVEGSGLGLAIVTRVATRWHGSVDLDSRPGRTVFSLSLPLADQVVA